MKNLLYGFIILFFNTAVKAGGLENIIVEKYYVSNEKDAKVSGGHLPAGSVTYRIYVDMKPGYKFQAAYGIPNHELRISTTTSFYNNEDYGATVPNAIPDRNLNENTVMLDSWLSVGAASENNLGILKEEDNDSGTIKNSNGCLQNENSSAGIPLSKRDGLIPGNTPLVTGFGIDSIIKIFGNKTENLKGQVFSTVNGSWASLNGSEGPSASNKVLIAQITTNGIFSFELNIQIGTPDGGVEQYVAKNAVAKEIYFPSLQYSSASENNNSKNAPASSAKK